MTVAAVTARAIANMPADKCSTEAEGWLLDLHRALAQDGAEDLHLRAAMAGIGAAATGGVARDVLDRQLAGMRRIYSEEDGVTDAGLVQRSEDVFVEAFWHRLAELAARTCPKGTA